MSQDIGPDNVIWIVNDIGELGVEIHGRAFFLYKGRSLEYGSHDDGRPMKYRRVYKREFGEVCHPVFAYDDGSPYARRITDRRCLGRFLPQDGARAWWLDDVDTSDPEWKCVENAGES